MSRRRREPREEARSAAPPAGRRRQPRVGLVVTVGIAAAAAAWWGAMHRRPPAMEPMREALPVAAMIDSAGAAEAAQDWAGMCCWLQRVRATDPGNPSYQVALGLAWHNLAWMGTPAGRERSATRTSLDRIITEKRVLAMLDSAATNARTPAQWARALTFSGTAYKNLGLPTDALRIFTIVHMRAPGATPALTHAAMVLGYLRDPQPPVPAADAVALEPARP